MRQAADTRAKQTLETVSFIVETIASGNAEAVDWMEVSTFLVGLEVKVASIYTQLETP